MHPLNMALRFVLELAALSGLAFAGWHVSDGVWRWVATICLPLIAAILWGVFAVPDDPSRSGGAPVPVSGLVRLALELVILGAGAAGLYVSGYRIAAIVMVAALIIHYAMSGERIAWLLQS